jgi:hypothetical protein
MRGGFKEFVKVWREKPMGKRGECLRCGGVWGDDARDGEGKI